MCSGKVDDIPSAAQRLFPAIVVIAAVAATLKAQRPPADKPPTSSCQSYEVALEQRRGRSRCVDFESRSDFNSMANCTQCAHELSDDAWICTECGAFQPEPAATLESADLANGSGGTPRPELITAAGLAADARRPAEASMGCCTQCGHTLPADAWLCTKCGAFQSEPAETPTLQPNIVAALPTDLPGHDRAGMMSGWQWLLSVVSFRHHR
jgi:hypothetical protein